MSQNAQSFQFHLNYDEVMVHPQGFYGAPQFKGQWPLPAERKFKLLVNFGIPVDGFQP